MFWPITAVMLKSRVRSFPEATRCCRAPTITIGGVTVSIFGRKAQRGLCAGQPKKASCLNDGSRQPAVLGAVIELGECLNLTQVENIELVQDAHRQLQELMAETGEPMPKNSRRGSGARNLDCAVFETLHISRKNGSLPPFDTVRAFFVEGEPLYPTAGIRQLDHVQICVRNPASIIGSSCPETSDPQPSPCGSRCPNVTRPHPRGARHPTERATETGAARTSHHSR
jgi:hypothetical protein